MELRGYQRESVESAIRDFREHQRLLGVAATGAGKTIMAAEWMRRANGNCLFLADATQLVEQNADKFHKMTGMPVSIDQGDRHAQPDAKTVIGTTQSVVRRLWKYNPNHFSLIIVDEAHRNCMGKQAQAVLNYFPDAKILGLTATPWRKDRKQLGDFFEKISFEVGLARLIREGYLSRITIKSVPVPIDLSGVRKKHGDFREEDLGDAMEPHLDELAQVIAEHAVGRKTVAFLPLIKISKMFCESCKKLGIYAVHVDGTDKEALAEYTHGSAQVICNASLLTTGWDHPETDCVFVARPTMSLSLYQQMVGRGTRIAPGKENLLLLDPLFMTDKHKIITPARLVASKPEQAQYIEDQLGEEEKDLMDLDDEAEEERLSKLQEEIEASRRKRARTVDALEFFVKINMKELAEYEPETAWEMSPPSEKQLHTLARFGIEQDCVQSSGQASKLLDVLFTRRREGYATIPQVKLIEKMGYLDPWMATFIEASRFINEKIGSKK